MPLRVSPLLWACAVLLLVRLVSLPLYPLLDRTESRYGEIAREMVVTQDWVTPHVNGRPFLAKPPLAMWCTAAGIMVFGPNEFAVRFPAWLATVLVIVLAWRSGALLGGRRVGCLAAVVCTTAPLTLFMAGGVMTDPYLVLGTSLALYATIAWAMRARPDDVRSHGTKRTACLFALGLSIATLSKGPIGLIFGGVPLLALLCTRAGRLRIQGFPWLGAATLYLFCTVPWFIVAEIRTPGFLEYFFVGEHFRRFVDPAWAGDRYGGTHPRPHGIIWLFFLLSLLPWIPIFPRLLGYERARMRPRAWGQYPVGLALVAAMLAPLLLFTAAGSLLITYAYPAIPPACLLLAVGIERHAGRGWILRHFRSHVPVGMAVIGVPVVVILAFLPSDTWVTGSQRAVLEGLPHRNLIYTRRIKYTYSASFYSAGRAFAVTDAQDPRWQLARLEPEDTLVITKAGRHERIPPDVRACLVLKRDVGGHFQVWALEPGHD